MQTKTYTELLHAAKKHVLHQDEALSSLAVRLYYHLQTAEQYRIYQKRYDLQQQIMQANANNTHVFVTINDPVIKPEPIGAAPIFLLGKTGSGKTHLVRELCKVSDVNFLSINVTHLSNAGYKGMTLAEVGEMLLGNAGNNLQKALFSVVFFDEFDKLFVATNSNQASYHRGLATELLTILEGSSPFPVKDSEGIDSGYMLFILGGSFGLHDQDHANAIGFMATNEQKTPPQNQLDFLKMGFFEELAGRIGQTIALAPLDNAMLADILLHSPSSPFVKLQKQLQLRDSEINITETLITKLITDNQEAIERFGVRGLYQAFNSLPQITEALVLGAYDAYVFTLDTDGLSYEPVFEDPSDAYEEITVVEKQNTSEHTPSSKNTDALFDDPDDIPF